MKRKKGSKADYEEVESLKRKMKISEAKGSMKDLAGYCNQLGNLYRIMGIYEDAIEYHKKEIKYCTKYNPDEKMGTAIAYRNIGEVYLDMKEAEKGINYTKKYLNEAKSQQDLVEEQRAHITLGRMYLGLVDDQDSESNEIDSNKVEEKSMYLERAEDEFQRGLEMLTKDGIKKKLDPKEISEMQCGAYLNIGLVHDFKEDYDESIKMIKKAIQVGKNSNLYESLHCCYLNLHVIYVKIKKYSDALQFIKLAIKTAKILKKKSEEISARFLESKVYLLMNDIEHGKNSLIKLRIKIKSGKSIDNSLLDELDPLLIAVLKIEKAEDQLNVTAKDNYKERIKQHEILGDNYAKLECYSEAIANYSICIEHAQQLKLDKKEVSKFYFSIGLTYKDIKDWVKSLEYFEKEMALIKSNPKDAFRTQSNIASVLEQYVPKQISKIIESYEKAIEYSKLTKCPAKEILAYKNIGGYLKSIKHQDSKKYLKIADELMKTHGLEDTESMADSQDLLDEIEEDTVNLSDLSGDDSYSDDDQDLSKNEAIVKKNWKNEKGETKLHVAAIKGDIKAIRREIKKGCPVNARDTAGWTPLHEACNYGHLEVVEELLKNKARVNDPGGAYSDGLTPLLDASSNGHLPIIKVLLKYGARITDKDKQGNNAIDILNVWWSKREREEKVALESEYKIIKKMLISKLEQNGIKYKEKKLDRKSQEDHSVQHSLIKKSYGKGNEDLIPVRIVRAGQDYDIDDGEKAIDDYAETMENLRRSNSNKKDNRRTTRAFSPIPAIIPEDSNVVDDWLEQDIPVDFNRDKRRRDPLEDIKLRDYKRRGTAKRNDLAVFDVQREKPVNLTDDLLNSYNNDNSSEELQDIENFDFESNLILPENESNSNSASKRHRHVSPDSSSSSSRESEKRRRRNNSSGPSTGTAGEKKSWTRQFSSHSIPSSEIIEVMESSEDEEMISRPKRSRLVQSKLPCITRIIGPKANSPEKMAREREQNVELNANGGSRNFQRILQPDKKHVKPLHLKVKVLERTLVVPIIEEEMDNTIDWLCKRTAERYFGLEKVKPVLTLSTKDGADFSSDDTIRLVIDDSSELLAKVFSYELKSLPERYKSACSDKFLEPENSIILTLSHCQSSNILTINDHYLRSGNLLFQALQYQYCLREINLMGCSLFDQGFKNLCEILHTMPGLLVLDVSCNGITSGGIQEFVIALQKKSENSIIRPPLGLATLNFSYNPLGNSIGFNVLEILARLTQLRKFQLTDCNLGVRLYAQIKTELTNAINISRLEELDISLNNWTEAEVLNLTAGFNANLRKNTKYSTHGTTTT